jgi:DNA-binding NarL/FixJ family response regulator
MKGIRNIQLNKVTPTDNDINVLLVGNNPIEMSIVYEKLFDLKDKIKRIETAFSQADMLNKIHLTHPNCIILDDNLGLNPLKAIIRNINELSKEAISITLLKTHNKQEVTSGVQEYILKDGIDSIRIYNALRNALKFKKTQQFFRIKYFSGKRNIKRLFI